MGGASFRPTSLFSHVKRSHGSGHLYVRYGSYYGRWRDELRERLAVEGARLSYRQNGESMQRIHASPAIASGASIA